MPFNAGLSRCRTLTWTWDLILPSVISLDIPETKFSHPETIGQGKNAKQNSLLINYFQHTFSVK
jgi:hypothetical protein